MHPPLALEAPPTYLALPVVEVVSQPVSIIIQKIKERPYSNMKVFLKQHQILRQF